MNPCILISDDEPLIVSILAREARREGLSVVSDTTSRNVLELARRHRPAVVVLDLIQPIYGADILMELKSDPETRFIKVIIFSVIEDQAVRHQCLKLGAWDYQVKPFDNMFMRKVARLARSEIESLHSCADPDAICIKALAPTAS